MRNLDFQQFHDDAVPNINDYTEEIKEKAREGALCAESKSPVWATKMLIDAINKMLQYLILPV